MKAAPDGSLIYQSTYQFIPAISIGYHLFKGLIRVGYNLQWVNQASGRERVQADALPSGYNQGLAQGSALSHQFAFGLTLPFHYLPMFDLVIRNAGGAHFKSSFSLVPFVASPAGLPAEIPMTIDGSIAIHPRFKSGLTLHLTSSVRDLTDQAHVAMLGHLSFGFEMDWREKVFLRTAWKGGYFSAGFGFRKPSAEASFAWFNEEIGSHYLSRRDAKYMFQYQFRIL